ncbi:hypothetical protein QBC44DRAFT_382440 [Cladorrhinum sp. PSN332]|nr:hypothetical protein QBC44DRAFT_382440 [Cladorrhinum sp. PSN332]
MHLTFAALLTTAALVAAVPGSAPGPAPVLAALITPGPVAVQAAQLQARQDSGPQPQDSPSPIQTGTQAGTETCLPSLSSLLLPFPTPPPEIISWSSAAILHISSAIIHGNFSFPSALAASNHVPALCTAAASGIAPMPTQDKELAAVYSAFLNDVQMWRFAVEGDAYSLAGRCGGMVGLGLELLMATEAPMCVSGVRETVRPWATGGVEGGIEISVSQGMKRGVEGVVRVGVVMGLVVGILVMGGL